MYVVVGGGKSSAKSVKYVWVIKVINDMNERVDGGCMVLIFYDDFMMLFFCCLVWLLDGLFVVFSVGVFKRSGVKRVMYTTYVYVCGNFEMFVMYLLGGEMLFVCVRFNFVLFKC